MQDMVFLAHRIPHPPDTGDKIRSWRPFEHLRERHRGRLGCFVDDPADCAPLPMLAERRARRCALEIAPRRREVPALGRMA